MIADFADSYAAGETPVPCVRCNQTVKFTDLTALARDLGAERLATGHYVRRVDGPDGPELHRAADPARDQSWFLFATTPRPAGVRAVPARRHAGQGARCGAQAARLGLAVADKPDSQDICFVPAGRYADVVARLRPDAAAPGEIVDRDGRVLGRHDGIARYTVGQAKRLGAAAQDGGAAAGGAGARCRARAAWWSGRATPARATCALREVNWLVAPPADALRCTVKLRAREAPQPATVRATADGAAVRLDAPALPAPGQACVFYDGDRVLGGGFIRAPGGG